MIRDIAESAATHALIALVLGFVLLPLGVGMPLISYATVAATVAILFSMLAKFLEVG